MNKLLKHVGVIVSYTVLTVLLTWPVAANIATHVAGSGGDPWQTLWRIEEKSDLARQAIKTGTVMELVKDEFGGRGDGRLVNLSVWPWLPVGMIFGSVIGYNLIWLASFAMAGYSMYLLVQWLVREKIDSGLIKTNANGVSNKWGWLLGEAPGFIAGLTYMLLPYHVAHARGHFGAMQMQWLPLVVLSAWSLIKQPRAWKAAVVVILLTVQAWSEHHYLLWLAILAAWYVIYYRAEVAEFFQAKQGLWYLLTITVLAGVTVGLALKPTVQLASQDRSPLALGQEQVIRYSTDPFAYVIPASFHPIWGSAAGRVWGKYFTGNVEETTVFMGWLVVLMVVGFHPRIPARQMKFWFIAAGIFFTISLGPRLHLLGYITPVPLPWELIDQWPIISAVRTVARAGIMVNLAAVVLFGWTLATQVKRWGSAGLIMAIVIVEFLLVPMPMMPAALPRVYETIKDRPEPAVIEIPAATNYTIASRALYGSRQHGKTVLNNIALERATGTEAYSEIRSLPALRQLLYLRTAHLAEGRDEFMEQKMLETLADVSRYVKAGQVIVHPDSLSAGQRAALALFLEEEARVRREVIDDVWLYDISQLPPGDGVFVARDDGWGEVGRDPETGATVAGIKDRATLTVYNINEGPVMVQFRWRHDNKNGGNLEIVGIAPAQISWDELSKETVIAAVVLPGQSEIVIGNKAERAAIIVAPVMRVITNMGVAL